MTTYSKRSNAKRAAIKALPPRATEGTDFHIVKNADGSFYWKAGIEAIPDALQRKNGPEEKRKAERVKRDLTDPKITMPKQTPKAKAKGKKRLERRTEGSAKDRVLKLLRRPDGANVEEIMAEMKWMSHTARGFISTLQSKQHVKLSKTREGRKVRYRAAA